MILISIHTLTSLWKLFVISSFGNYESYRGFRLDEMLVVITEQNYALINNLNNLQMNNLRFIMWLINCLVYPNNGTNFLFFFMQLCGNQ